MDDREPVAWEYGEERGWIFRYEALSDMEGWRRAFDELRSGEIEWRPYRARQFRGWADTGRHEGYFLSQCFIIGTLPRIVECYRPDRVFRQFGRIQDIPVAPILFRRYSREVPWGGFHITSDGQGIMDGSRTRGLSREDRGRADTSGDRAVS